MNKCYSINEEDYNFDSISAVIDDLTNNTPLGESIVGLKYYEADAVPILHKHVFDKDDTMYFLENLDNQVGDQIGDCFDMQYTDVRPDELQDLTDLIMNWLKNNIKEGKYYRVVNSQQKFITLEDLE